MDSKKLADVIDSFGGFELLGDAVKYMKMQYFIKGVYKAINAVKSMTFEFESCNPNDVKQIIIENLESRLKALQEKNDKNAR